jgi:fibronectin type 3 domain-containing protein
MILRNKFLIFYGLLLLLITITSCSGGTPTTTLGTPESVPSSSNVGAPYSVSSTDSSTSSITLRWYAYSSANYFEIYRSTESGGTYEKIGENNDCLYVDSSLSPATYYYYKIKALWRSSVTPSKIVEGSFSSFYKGNTILETPQSVSASEDNTSHVTVSWQPVSGAASYKIYRVIDYLSTFSLLKADETGLSYNDTTPSVGYKYKYKVSAVASSGIEGLKSTEDSGYKCTASPTNLVASDGLYSNVIKLTWYAASNSPLRYQIYRSVNGGEFSYMISTSSSTTAYSDTSVVFGNTYAYKVMAEYIGGGFSLLSASDSGYIRNPAEPVQYSITWAQNRESAVNRAGGGYKLYYSQTSNFDIASASYKDIPYISGAHTPITTTLPLTVGSWYLKVVAYSSLNGSSNSIPSNEILVVIE